MLLVVKVKAFPSLKSPFYSDKIYYPMQNKLYKNKKRVQRLRQSGLRPWRMVASILLVICGIVFFPFWVKRIRDPWMSIALFFIFFQAVAVVIDVLQGRIPLKFNMVIKAFSKYVWGTILEILFLLLILPVIAIEIILGPFMAFLFLLSLYVLGLFFIEKILKIDIKGVISFLQNWIHAAMALVIALLSGLVCFKNAWLERFIDCWVDKATDLITFIEAGERKGDQVRE